MVCQGFISGKEGAVTDKVLAENLSPPAASAPHSFVYLPFKQPKIQRGSQAQLTDRRGTMLISESYKDVPTKADGEGKMRNDCSKHSCPELLG